MRIFKSNIACCFILFLFISFFSYGKAPSGIADSLFISGKFYAASVEYEREAFLSAGNAARTKALLKKSDCFLQSGNYEEAEKTTERLIYSGLNDTLVTECRYHSALCSYLAGNFSNAENHLLQMQAFVKDSTLTRPSLPLYALVLNELQRWEEAKQKALQAIRVSGLSDTEKDTLAKKVNSLYTPANYPHLKNMVKAQNMSSFLPGLGQLYAGYFGEGVASALVNAASLGLVAYLIIAPPHLYLTGLLGASPLFTKFYFGGINRLAYLVEKRNYKVLRNYNDSLKKMILPLAK